MGIDTRVWKGDRWVEPEYRLYKNAQGQVLKLDAHTAGKYGFDVTSGIPVIEPRDESDVPDTIKIVALICVVAVAISVIWMAWF